jgi:hypothetical protein
MSDVFISYSRIDKVFARELNDHLEARNKNAYFTVRGIEIHEK